MGGKVAEGCYFSFVFQQKQREKAHFSKQESVYFGCTCAKVHLFVVVVVVN